MTQTITGLFDSYEDAKDAVHDLEAAGVPHGDISLVANNAHGEHGSLGESRADKAGEDAGKGAGLGATVGVSADCSRVWDSSPFRGSGPWLPPAGWRPRPWAQWSAGRSGRPPGDWSAP